MSPTCDLKHAAPADQPTHVRQVASRLFPAYTIDEGRVHLAGCTLEDRPFLRFLFRVGTESVETYLSEAGSEVDRRLVQALGMKETIELPRAPTRTEVDVDGLIETATRLIQARTAEAAPLELVDATAIWCKFASGKLQFTVGERIAELPFAGWSRLLEPPPYPCPHTGRETFHLAATADGRITAAECVEICAETGQRVLAHELETCAVTGRRVKPELLVTCPVSGGRVLPNVMVTCSTCRQQVSPMVVEQDECSACRDMQPVSPADARVAQLVDRYRVLDGWRQWQIGQNSTIYILMASGWLRQLLLVVDKESLALKRVATRNRLAGNWKDFPTSQYDSLLRA